MLEADKTFLEILTTFRTKQEINEQDQFTAAYSVCLIFDNAQTTSARLSILYILYSYYSDEQIDRNPFLTFFLQLVDEMPANSIEAHFIYCILEKSLPNLDQVFPKDVSNETLPPVSKDNTLIKSLKLKVARLIDDPDIPIMNQQAMDLFAQATSRLLTLSEIELLKNELLLGFPASQCIPPNALPNLINHNQFLAMDIVPLLLQTNQASLYLQSLLNTTLTTNSLEVVHHILVSRKIPLSQDFIHYYISKSIMSCDQLEEGMKRDKQVKQVARFIESLIEHRAISMTDYFIEIQSFCVNYMKLKGVANLYRLASNESQHQILLNQQGTSSSSV